MQLQEMTTKLGFEVDAHQLEHLHERLEGIGHAVKFLAGVELVKGLYELAERFANMGEHLESTAIAAGLTTTELQKLQFAASQNAVGGDELAGAMAKLNRTLYMAKEGGKGAIATFAKLGITPEQIASFDTSTEALAAVQDAIAGVTDANARQAIVMQLFGRGSSNMVKFLVQGSKATQELGDSAEKMGAVVDEEGVRALAEFEDAASGLGQVFKSFMATIGGTFAPAFREVIHLIEDQWASSVTDMRRSVQIFAEKAAFYIGYVAEGFRILIMLITWFVQDHMGLLLFIAKWAPALFLAQAAFEGFTKAVGATNTTLKALNKWGPKALGALGKALEVFQLGALYFIEWGIRFVSIFDPKLALRIRAVTAALAQMSALRFFLLAAGWAVAAAALAVAIHDLYQYFFNDVPYEKLWIARLLKKAEPIISRLKWLLKPFKELFMLGDMDADDPSRGLTAEQTEASMRKGPMSALTYGPELFSGAGAMGMKFDPNAPVENNSATTNMYLHAPVSINVPPGTPPDLAVRLAKEGTTDVMMQMLGNASREVHPAAAR